MTCSASMGHALGFNQVLRRRLDSQTRTTPTSNASSARVSDRYELAPVLGKVAAPAGGDDAEPAVGSAVGFEVGFVVGAIATVTTNADEALLPDGSVAVQVTVVAPSWKTVPDAGRHATLEEPELSVAFGGANVTAAPVPEASVTAMSAGSPITGLSLSLTTMLNEALAVFPAKSVAVQVTVVVPIGKNELEAGLQTMFPAGNATAISGARGGSSSDAPTANVTVAPFSPGSLLTISAERSTQRWRYPQDPRQRRLRRQQRSSRRSSCRTP